MTPPPRRSHLAWNLFLGLYVAAGVFCLVWPGYAWFAGRIEPFVLGLPFSFAWHIGWILASCVVLGLYHRGTRAGRDAR